MKGENVDFFSVKEENKTIYEQANDMMQTPCRGVPSAHSVIYEQANDMMQTDHEYIGELYDYFDAAFLKLFLKNGAICERDEFETKVKQIGMR